MELTTLIMFVIILGFLTHIVYKNNEGDGKLMALIDVVNDIKAAIADLAARVAGLPEPGKVAELEALIAEERAAHEAYVAAEDAEDVEQNQAIADAEAAVDAKLAEIAEAEAALTDVKAQVEEIAAAPVVVDPVEEEEPAEPEVPVEEPAEEPEVEVPAEEELPFEEDEESAEEAELDPLVDSGIPYEGEPGTATDEDGNRV